MKNKYFEQSKAKDMHNDDDLLSWKIQYDVDKGYSVIFSDGTKKTCKDKKQARQYINEKFFSMYF